MEKQPQTITQVAGYIEINRLYQNNHHLNDIMETKIPFTIAIKITYEMLEIYLIRNVKIFMRKKSLKHF